VLQASAISGENQLLHLSVGYVVIPPSGRGVYRERWLPEYDDHKDASKLVDRAWELIQVNETDFANVKLSLRSVEAIFFANLHALEIVYDILVPSEGFEEQRRVAWIPARRSGWKLYPEHAIALATADDLRTLGRLISSLKKEFN
jgi:hypothetical protein